MLTLVLVPGVFGLTTSSVLVLKHTWSTVRQMLLVLTTVAIMRMPVFGVL